MSCQYIPVDEEARTLTSMYARPLEHGRPFYAVLGQAGRVCDGADGEGGRSVEHVERARCRSI